MFDSSIKGWIPNGGETDVFGPSPDTEEYLRFVAEPALDPLPSIVSGESNVGDPLPSFIYNTYNGDKDVHLMGNDEVMYECERRMSSLDLAGPPTLDSDSPTNFGMGQNLLVSSTGDRRRSSSGALGYLNLFSPRSLSSENTTIYLPFDIKQETTEHNSTNLSNNINTSTSLEGYIPHIEDTTTLTSIQQKQEKLQEQQKLQEQEQQYQNKRARAGTPTFKWQVQEQDLDILSLNFNLDGSGDLQSWGGIPYPNQRIRTRTRSSSGQSSLRRRRSAPALQGKLIVKGKGEMVTLPLFEREEENNSVGFSFSDGQLATLHPIVSSPSSSSSSSSCPPVKLEPVKSEPISPRSRLEAGHSGFGKFIKSKISFGNLKKSGTGGGGGGGGGGGVTGGVTGGGTGGGTGVGGIVSGVGVGRVGGESTTENIEKAKLLARNPKEIPEDAYFRSYHKIHPRGEHQSSDPYDALRMAMQDISKKNRAKVNGFLNVVCVYQALGFLSAEYSNAVTIETNPPHLSQILRNCSMADARLLQDTYTELPATEIYINVPFVKRESFFLLVSCHLKINRKYPSRKTIQDNLVKAFSCVPPRDYWWEGKLNFRGVLKPTKNGKSVTQNKTKKKQRKPSKNSAVCGRSSKSAPPIPPLPLQSSLSSSSSDSLDITQFNRMPNPLFEASHNIPPVSVVKKEPRWEEEHAPFPGIVFHDLTRT